MRLHGDEAAAAVNSTVHDVAATLGVAAHGDDLGQHRHPGRRRTRLFSLARHDWATWPRQQVATSHWTRSFRTLSPIVSCRTTAHQCRWIGLFFFEGDGGCRAGRIALLLCRLFSAFLLATCSGGTEVGVGSPSGNGVALLPLFRQEALSGSRSSSGREALAGRTSCIRQVVRDRVKVTRV
jgi:hypothetical protein